MVAPIPSAFDGNQVLQHAFDEVNGRLRVDAAITVGGPGTAVIIDHIDDSIRLGDGTNFLTSTTIGPKIGLDVNIINTALDVNIQGLSTPGVQNIAIASSNTEQTLIIATNTKKVRLKLRGSGTLKISYSLGTSGTVYYTIPAGSEHIIDNLDLAGPTNLYYQSTASPRTLEVETWI